MEGHKKKLVPVDPLAPADSSSARRKSNDKRSDSESESGSPAQHQHKRTNSITPKSPLALEVDFKNDSGRHSELPAPLSRQNTVESLGKKKDKHAETLKEYRKSLKEVKASVRTSNNEIREKSKSPIDESLLQALVQRLELFESGVEFAKELYDALGRNLSGMLVVAHSFETLKEFLMEQTKTLITFYKFRAAYMLAVNETLLGDWCVKNPQHTNVAGLLSKQLQLGNNFTERKEHSVKLSEFNHLLDGDDMNRIEHINADVSKLARWKVEGELEFFRRLLMKADEVQKTIELKKDILRVRTLTKSGRAKVQRVNSANSLGKGMYEDFMDQFISWSEEFLKKEGISDEHRTTCKDMLSVLKTKRMLDQPLSKEDLDELIWEDMVERHPQAGPSHD